ncbi:TraB/GumN family protein [Halogeometricum borinquense]|uniref:TraB/GumN family protein n=1 Tax=Halogeometricum borinquense TaxID=60847 RepID=UPI0034450D2C
MSERTENGTIRIVGTAHVSADSVREVESVIRDEHPDVVAVELDEDRYRRLTGDTDDPDPEALLESTTSVRLILHWVLSYVQAQLGDQFDIEPGSELLKAVETADEIGTDIALVDRDIRVTVQRFWSQMTIREKLRLAGGLLLGFADARTVGLVFGLFIGITLGPIVGLFGGNFGVTDPLLTRVAASGLLALAVGTVLYTAGKVIFDHRTVMTASLTGGVSIGLLAGAGLGVADGTVTAYLPPMLLHGIGSLLIGLSAGLVVGVLGGLVAERLGLSGIDIDEADEFVAEDLTDADVVQTILTEFRELCPNGARALIDERDAYIAHQLVALRDSGLDVVAVLGAGHRGGVEQYLSNPATLPPHETLVGTSRGPVVPVKKIAGALISVAFVASFVLLAMAGVDDAYLLEVFVAWFLVNGVFAAGMAYLAGACWTAALTGGAVAWLTSVNPVLAPGWFVGYVELRRTPVDVTDFDALNELVSGNDGLSDIRSKVASVPLLRLLAIVALTNVGSIVASVLFVAYLLPLFAGDLGGVDAVSRLLFEGLRNGADILWRSLTSA